LSLSALVSGRVWSPLRSWFSGHGRTSCWQSVLHRGSHYEPLGTGLNNRPARSTPGTAPLRSGYGSQGRARHVPDQVALRRQAIGPCTRGACFTRSSISGYSLRQGFARYGRRRVGGAVDAQSRQALGLRLVWAAVPASATSTGPPAHSSALAAGAAAARMKGIMVPDHLAESSGRRPWGPRSL
jgi:hypothetical protein